MICPKCGTNNSSDDKFCFKCGTQLPLGQQASGADQPKEPNSSEAGEKAGAKNPFSFTGKSGGSRTGKRQSFFGGGKSAGAPDDGVPKPGSAPIAEDRLTINATTALAAKKARVADVKSMRPLTQVAFNIVESDRSPIISTLVSVINIALSLGLVATIIMIFDTANAIVAASTSRHIEGNLLTDMYEQVSTDNGTKLLWLIVIFIAIGIAFITCGRLSIRIKKVNRKKRKENLTSRL